MSQALAVKSPPATLVQFWDSDAPDEVQGLLDSVRDVNPELGYRFFDDETAKAFIGSEYGSEMAALYDSCSLRRCDRTCSATLGWRGTAASTSMPTTAP